MSSLCPPTLWHPYGAGRFDASPALRDNERFLRWTLSPREQVTAERRRSMREQKAIRRALSRAANDADRQRKLLEREARFEAYRQQRQEARTRASDEPKAAAIQASERAR